MLQTTCLNKNGIQIKKKDLSWKKYFKILKIFKMMKKKTENIIC